MLTKHAQEREVVVGRGNKASRKLRWRHHKYITNEDNYTHKIPTMDINGTYSETKKQMLKTFMQYNGIDILFLQEVVKKDFRYMTRYAAHINIGTEQLAAAVMTRHDRTDSN
jgi:hypothetical protein